MIELALAAGAAAGLASVPHCAGMCGPLAVLASTRGSSRGQLGYHLGRLVGYATIGLLAGAGGGAVELALPARWASALLSWSLALALGLTALRLWRGDRAAARPVVLGTAPRKPTLPERAIGLLPKHPVSLGLMTALLPCGALYAGLLVAAGSGSALGGATSMLAFGATSAVGLAAVGAIALKAKALVARGTDAVFFSRVLSTALLVGALVLAVRPIASLRQTEPSCHDPGGSVAAAEPRPSDPGRTHPLRPTP